MSLYHRFRSSAGRGFTLIELLVVISIIALLVGLLLPALSKARLSAMNTLGSADKRGIVECLNIYATDNNNFMPIEPQVTFIDVQSAPAGSEPGGSGIGPGSTYGIMGLSGHVWYESAGYAGLASATSTPAAQPYDTRYFHGAARVIPMGYMALPLPFYHPVMRDQTQNDIGGGSRRNWFYYMNNQWQYSEGSSSYLNPDPLVARGWGTDFTGTVGTTYGLGYWGCTTAYRGGFWATYTGNGTAGNFVNDPSTVGIVNCRTDANKFNAHALLMDTPFENQFQREGGKLDYARGDGSVGFTTNTVFQFQSGGVAAPNAGSGPSGYAAPALTQSAANGGFCSTTSIPWIDTAGSHYSLWSTADSSHLSFWNDSLNDAFDMDRIDQDNGVSP